MYREKNAVYKFIKAILSEYDYCRGVMKKHFNNNHIMPAEEERFQLSNICWICNKLFDVGDDRVRDHCHIAGNIEVLHIGVVILMLSLSLVKKFL